LFGKIHRSMFSCLNLGRKKGVRSHITRFMITHNDVSLVCLQKKLPHPCT
jgi:hypothetical protein